MKVYLIPNLLTPEGTIDDIPKSTITICSNLKLYFVEEVRTARRFLKRILPEIVIDDLTFIELNEHTNGLSYSDMIATAKQFKECGMISESGSPAIADPGEEFVALAHQHNFEIIPLVGPSSLIQALMASGFNGERFCFNGYIPKDNKEKTLFLKLAEKKVQQQNETQLFIETPYNNIKTLDIIINSLQPSTMLCIASNIGTNNEFIKTKSIINWKQNLPNINKQPTLFLIGK